MNRPIDSGAGFGMSPLPPGDGKKDSAEPQLPYVRFNLLTDEMMQFRPSRGVNYSPFRFPDLNPQEFLASLGDAVPKGILIPDGMEMPKPMLDPTVRVADSSRVSGVTLVAHRYREHGGIRRFLVLEFLSKYPDGVKAMQKVQLETDSREPGNLQYHGVALVDPNAETGGYQRTPELLATEEQADAFVGKARQLFEEWKNSPEGVTRAKRSHVTLASKTS